MNNYTKHSNPVNSNTVLNGEPLISDVYLMDCMELMKQYPDNYFDICCVDTPYGINRNGMKLHFVACELDKEYYDAQNKRYEEFISQLRIV